ncbi:peptidoglycan DD-metalloendopeptidase family protein [Simiduia sp. 21SJ11W-1]|uniref:peptidoglycan DD-metalloendopeptidase family protein n=1 Tax=Simiduia sp. 21SJ11W-1 TaxID=2909669 RepID=UPI00209FEF71|nr:peptidoglycan DD-metalloendopeptidase family protein [Simiduia sp. 21SJ11W-1]UTA49637.1 peptidoglycan DD-metalloendopeptidase family protein [Simiduia sp. 21SJ11W-1]
MAVALALLLGLFGCASGGGGAPVSERTRPAPISGVDRHVVKPGDTLYSIAWRYGVDYKALSRRNGIGSSYTIYPGQIIYLDVDKKPVTAKSRPVVKRSPTTTQKPVAKMPAAKPVIPVKTAGMIGPVNWVWPAKGRIIRNYSPASGLNKGIDIEGRLGEPVHSAGAGTVVYAGDGLRGYGKLLIIKHDETYLSAYAHNSKLFVKEGDKVKGNQKIAEIGSSGTDTTKLHFEIRRKGQPVDPLKYLPKR